MNIQTNYCINAAFWKGVTIDMASFTWHDGGVPADMEITQVYGLIFSRDGRLILKEEKKENATKFSLAGGHPESFDAGIEGTLRREVLEEINVTISEPIMLGYQKVDEGDNSPPFAQVRMLALIDWIGDVRPDTANGKTYNRILVSPRRAIELLQWGIAGAEQIIAAMKMAAKAYDINVFTEKDEYI